MKTTSKLLTTLVAGSLGGLAHATPVTLSDTVTLGTLLNNQTTTIHYDATNLLASAGMSGGNILSGSLVVYGLSNIDYHTTGDSYSGYNVTGSSQRGVSVPYTYYTPYYVSGHSYSCGWLGWSTCHTDGYTAYEAHTGYDNHQVTDYALTQQHTVTHTDTQDTMTVTAGGTSKSGVDSTTAHSDTYGQPVYQGQDYNQYSSSATYYKQDHDVYDSVSGPLQVMLSLDTLALNALRETGYIDIVVGATGQFALQSINFTVSAVPEPASILLSLTGLAALGATRRKKKMRA